MYTFRVVYATHAKCNERQLHYGAAADGKTTVEGVRPSRKMLVCTLVLEARANSAVTQPFPLNHTCSCRSHRLAIFRSDVSVGHYFNCHENTAQFRLRTALVARLIVRP